MADGRTHRIDLAEFDPEYAGEWVDIRESLSWRQRNDVDVGWMKIRPSITQSSDGTQGVSARFAEIPAVERVMVLMETALVAWSLKDRNGAPLPVGRAGLDHEDFDGELGDWLLQLVQKYYAAFRRTAEERKKSAEISMGSTPTEASPSDIPPN